MWLKVRGYYMTRQILIDNIVRQTTVLIAQLATSGGVRAPLAQIADRVFLDLSRELESQGLSRTVIADMFGIALRSYRRRIRQLSESSTERGRTLWEAVLDYLNRDTLVTREQVLRRFERDDEILVKSVIQDLCESGLVLRLGTAKAAAYRAATAAELAEVQPRDEGLDELVWLLVYREGPITAEDLAARIAVGPENLQGCLERLQEARRIEPSAAGTFSSGSIVLPLGGTEGWEAAIFDHFQAMVRTINARLTASAESAAQAETGGSTYTFYVWPGHPLEEQTRTFLKEFRQRQTDLRKQVEAYAEKHPRPTSYDKVIVYGGQCVIHEDESNEDNDETA
jgi:hypothetical protein